MEELGDYIYILVMIIALVGGMFTNKKKKEEAKKETMLPFPDLSDVISGEGDQEFVHTKSEKSFQEIVAEKFQAMQSNFKEVESQIYSSSGSSKDQKDEDLPLQIVDDYEEDTWLSDISLEDIDEAQKAFIYSEIMTRKYS